MKSDIRVSTKLAINRLNKLENYRCPSILTFWVYIYITMSNTTLVMPVVPQSAKFDHVDLFQHNQEL